MKAKNYFTTKRIAFMALFTALVTVATFVIQIPSPAGQGYINIGDTMIFLCAALFDPLFALVAGGLGSALADLFSGFAAYAPFTLAVKGLEGLFAALLVRLFKKTKMPFFVNCTASMAVGGLWMSVGYCLAETVMFGWTLGVANMPYNLIQAGINLVLGVALATAFKNIRGINGLLSLDGEDDGGNSRRAQ